MTNLLKSALIVIIVDGSVIRALEPAEITAAKKLYNETFNSGSIHQHVQKLSFAQQELLKAYYRSLIEDMKRRGEEDDVHIASSSTVLNLALLGDDWAREQVVQSFWNNSRAKATQLHYLNDPKVIAMIGEGLFMEEEEYRLGDVGFMPTQDNIAEVFIDTLGNSPDFNPDVINWARRVNHWSAEIGSRELKFTRDWYRANETKLKAGDFKAVQPGAEPPERNASAPVDRPPSSVPGISSPNSKPISSPGSTQTQDSAGNVYAWIAAFLLAASGGLVWLLKHKRS